MKSIKAAINAFPHIWDRFGPSTYFTIGEEETKYFSWIKNYNEDVFYCFESDPFDGDKYKTVKSSEIITIWYDQLTPSIELKDNGDPDIKAMAESILLIMNERERQIKEDSQVPRNTTGGGNYKGELEKDDQKCDHCQGTGFDSYPNHQTAYPVCPKCNP